MMKWESSIKLTNQKLNMHVLNTTNIFIIIYKKKNIKIDIRVGQEQRTGPGSSAIGAPPVTLNKITSEYHIG